MDNKVQLIEGFLLTVGSAYSLATIETVLGVIILVVQLIWICAKLGVKIYQAFKGKATFEDVGNEFKETIEELTDIKNDVSSKGGDVNE